MRYRARPLEIDAVLWTGDANDLPADWVPDLRLTPTGNAVDIDTLEGPALAKPGQHYIVRGTVGEFYPVRKDIFEAKYAAVLDE